MTDSLEIRAASMKDSQAILTCLRAAFEPYRAQYTSAAFTDTVLGPDTIQKRMSDMRVLVAVSEQSIVGTIAYAATGEEGHFRGMAVFPDWHGSGVASALLSAAEDELRKMGCQFVTLDTTEPLQRAVRFYEKRGFSASGKVTDFFGMSLYEYSKSLVL
jgi:GNAT superfamily N-acetyltransferase